MILKYIGIGFIIAIIYYLIKSKVSNPREKYMSHDDHDDEDVEVLAQSGRTMAAIKAYRKLHGVGLKEAKDAVDAMLTKGYHDSHHVDDDMNLSQDEEILRIANSGHKIQAIKLYREVYGVGLKEAKDAVETMLRNN
jgi:ribosomal protein L7/L12